jgi:uncharacterized repeat protein (TIGR03803 family)
MSNSTQDVSWISVIVRRLAPTFTVAIILALAVLASASAQAQDFEFSRILHSFTGPPDGQGLNVSKLTLDAEGNLYGTTAEGGNVISGYPFGAGTVYKVDSSGNETVLYRFAGAGGDGASPQAGVVLDADGNLYGSTYYGGDLSCGVTKGCGTIFKLDTTGHETVLYTFLGVLGAGPADGANPSGDLVLDSQGNLYGTTYAGGVDSVGIIFKLTNSGVESILYQFICCLTGAGPSGLLRDAAGNFYGTTHSGGGSGPKDVCGDFGCGTVYELSASGTYTLLHGFSFDSEDGVQPNAGLVMDAQGNLYGTTFYGGATAKSRTQGGGIVFELEPNGNESILHQFCAPPDPNSCPDGVWPSAGLTMDSAGNLYGTTSSGNSSNGTIFLLNVARSYSVLYDFKRARGGAYMPSTEVVFDPQGNLYLATEAGGADELGTAFALLTAAAETSISLDSSPNPSTYGQPVTFTANVKTSTGTPNDGEEVTFMTGTTVLGTSTLSAGLASFTTSTLAVRTTTVTAAYGGDTHHVGSTSNQIKQLVKKSGTTTVLSSLPNPSKSGQAVTFTAVVNSSTAVVPDGETVTFKYKTTVLGTGTLSRGSASITTSTLPAGSDSIKATYGGDADNLGSSSNQVKQVVN